MGRRGRAHDRRVFRSPRRVRRGRLAALPFAATALAACGHVPGSRRRSTSRPASRIGCRSTRSSGRSKPRSRRTPRPSGAPSDLSASRASASGSRRRARADDDSGWHAFGPHLQHRHDDGWCTPEGPSAIALGVFDVQCRDRRGRRDGRTDRRSRGGRPYDTRSERDARLGDAKPRKREGLEWRRDSNPRHGPGRPPLHQLSYSRKGAIDRRRYVRRR